MRRLSRAPEPKRIPRQLAKNRGCEAANCGHWSDYCPLKAGITKNMGTDVEIDRALAVVTATLNDQKLDRWERQRVQEIVTQALGSEPYLKVDDGGGLHDERGARIGAIRRTGSGEWITERQNDAAENSDTAIPVPGQQSKLRKALTKLKIHL
jgi:hypothetical protein